MKCKAVLNPFRIPAEYSQVITFLNRIHDGDIPEKVNGTLTLFPGPGSNSTVVTDHKIYLLTQWSSPLGIHGAIADRFNTNIFQVLDVLETLEPSAKKEVEAFRTWLAAEAYRAARRAREAAFKKEALELGYEVRKL
jgi:hypothetical protein